MKYWQYRTAFLALLVLAGALPLPAEVRAQPAARLSGIDLSHHNEVHDWPAVAGSGQSFVILKATDGMDYLDPTFLERFALAADLGIVRGAYHFYETNDDPIIQADWFIANVGLQPGDLPPIVDIEHIKTPVFDSLHGDFDRFLRRLERHYGAAPIIYTGPTFWNHAMKEHLPGYPLWIAQYATEIPVIPSGWAQWTIWQHTDALRIDGIDGDVDGSYFNGDTDALRDMLLTPQ